MKGALLADAHSLTWRNFYRSCFSRWCLVFLCIVVITVNITSGIVLFHQIYITNAHSKIHQIQFLTVVLIYYLQGDYIKHPVLYELSHKYGFTDNLPESALPNRLEEIKEAIRREIRKELKVIQFRFFFSFVTWNFISNGISKRLT